MSEEQASAGSDIVNEFEREPVPKSSLLGFKSFVGMYAGEHCAGTELMIGPLFVANGASAFDLVVGLLVGNALAVLSWMFLCAPIATRVRLTLYYQLEKICGRSLVSAYNVFNGVVFCLLAGSMVTVSATAVGVWFDFPMPGLSDILPNSYGWVVAVLAIGSVISIVAAFGYETVSKFANIAAPWMVLVFLAFGFIALANFVEATDTTINTPGDLWTLANTEIWPDVEPLPGQPDFGFWHVAFFAWFCNMALHVGMSDLTVFRYARKSWYAIATSAGMYVGHFMAWIAAAALFANYLYSQRPDEGMVSLLVNHGNGQYTAAELADTPLTAKLLREAMEIRAELPQDTLNDAERNFSIPTVAPGPLAYGACGLAGLLCVIIAGWTTANPTIYRAGLAFQAIVPRWSRFKVTLATGALATLAGLFPAIAMKILEFLALSGMMLMPMGAIVFVDFWLLKKFGMQSNYAELSRSSFNLAAGLTWFLTMGTCVALVKFAGIQIYFVSLPGWFLAAVLYVIISKLYQRKIHEGAAE